MRVTQRRLSWALASLGLLTPIALGADTAGPVAPIAMLRINSPSADNYTLFHGQIRVGDSIGGYAIYDWGGSRCPGKTLAESEVAALQRAFNNPRIWIEPQHKVGQGGSLCLVGFSFVLRSELGALP